jgi:hypothetical protein
MTFGLELSWFLLPRPHGAAEVKMIVPRRPDSWSPFQPAELWRASIHWVDVFLA